jgi:hypothetical protein
VEQVFGKIDGRFHRQAILRYGDIVKERVRCGLCENETGLYGARIGWGVGGGWGVAIGQTSSGECGLQGGGGLDGAAMKQTSAQRGLRRTSDWGSDGDVCPRLAGWMGWRVAGYLKGLMMRTPA